MSRHVIAIEGVPTVLPGIWLTPGSLRMSDDHIPVCYNFDYSTVIGRARDLERSNHEVSVEIELFSGWDNFDEGLFDFTFYANELVEEIVPATDEVEARKFILEARVRAIAIVPNAAHPAVSQDLQGP